MMFGCSWSSCGGSSRKETQTRTVRNGQTVTTTTTYTVVQHNPTASLQPNVQWKTITGPRNDVSSGPEPPSKPFKINDFEQQCLAEHNRLRALHGCPPLVLNRRLCAYATEWAKNLANRRILQHRSEGKYGENLYMASGKVVDGKTVVKCLYDEIALYKYSRPGFSSGTGHFTQVVWKSSKELGVGVEKRGDSIWVVMNYDPPGNFADEFVQNVPRPLR